MSLCVLTVMSGVSSQHVYQPYLRSDSRHREDPQKYFVVEADFDEVDADLMRVGSNLTAVITTATINDAFLLPQQAVFFEEDASFVYVLEGSAQVAREVSLGHRSPTLVEVTSGLTSGELVSVAPEGGNS